MFVLVDESSQYCSASDPGVFTAWGGVIGARRDKLQCSVRPAAVVVGAVLGEDGPQVAFAEDQDAVSELGSNGQDEAFGEAVRSRTARRDLHGIDAGAGQDGVERGGELAARSRTRNRDVAARSSRSISRFRACWVVQAPVGWLVAPRMCT